MERTAMYRKLDNLKIKKPKRLRNNPIYRSNSRADG